MASRVAPAGRQSLQARPERGCALEGTVRSCHLSAVSRRDTRVPVRVARRDAVGPGLEKPAGDARCPEDVKPGCGVHVQTQQRLTVRFVMAHRRGSSEVAFGGGQRDSPTRAATFLSAQRTRYGALRRPGEPRELVARWREPAWRATHTGPTTGCSGKGKAADTGEPMGAGGGVVHGWSTEGLRVVTLLCVTL